MVRKKLCQHIDYASTIKTGNNRVLEQILIDRDWHAKLKIKIKDYCHSKRCDSTQKWRINEQKLKQID